MEEDKKPDLSGATEHCNIKVVSQVDMCVDAHLTMLLCQENRAGPFLTCVRLQDGASVQFKIKCAYIQLACSSRCLHGTSIHTCL